MDRSTLRVGVIGAGPAGLSAAYTLSAAGARVTVLEADESHVGGISRTEVYKGCRYDIGGHRFFSKSPAINALWNNWMPRDFIHCERVSRILQSERFFSYPLRPLEVLTKLGAWEATHCVGSYIWARLCRPCDRQSLEQWLIGQFGNRLYRTFFKSYSEKVWGLDCRELSSDWATQRIRGLSLSSLIFGAIKHKQSGPRKHIPAKTLTKEFHFPRLGAGMMWAACAERIERLGGRVALGRRVVACTRNGNAGTFSIQHVGSDRTSDTLVVDRVISSAPLPELIRGLRPYAGDEATDLANTLRYRDFVLIVVIGMDERKSTDQWLYVQRADVRVARVQNFKCWSSDMVPDERLVSFGCEYFCQEDDEFWSSPDSHLADLACCELSKLGLLRRDRVVDTTVVRQRKAYPVYDLDYAKRVQAIRGEVESRFPGLYLVGRNGMHRYNNQDHSMMTGVVSANSILAGTAEYDAWQVNVDAEYGERGADVAPVGCALLD